MREKPRDGDLGLDPPSQMNLDLCWHRLHPVTDNDLQMDPCYGESSFDLSTTSSTLFPQQSPSSSPQSVSLPWSSNWFTFLTSLHRAMSLLLLVLIPFKKRRPKSPSHSTIHPHPSFSSSIRSLSVMLLLLLLLSLMVHPSHQVRYGCPGRSLIRPCHCHDKNKGVDITCEGASMESMRDSFQNIAESGHTAMYLKLTRNHLPTVPSFFISGLTVVHLVANYNNISSIEVDAFSGLEEKLESLDLAQNSLHHVPTAGLQGLSSLVSLNLNYNYLEVLPPNCFRGLISLLRLSIYGNKLKTIDPSAFFGIGGNLTRINLGSNRLMVFPTEAFRNLSSLQRIELHENRISSISRQTFYGMSPCESLDTMNLAGNAISTIPANCFQDMKVLNLLDIERNQLETVHLNAFNGVEDTMEWLKLGNNQLSSIPSESLRHLVKLRELDLRGNNISIIERDSLNHFGSNLKFIYFQKNGIRRIEDGAFNALLSLEWLYLNNNQLNGISLETFKPVLDSLTVLDVHNNPFDCNCDIAWFVSYSQTKGSSVVSQPKETRCSDPPNNLLKVAVSDAIRKLPHCSTSSVSSSLVMTTTSVFLSLLLSLGPLLPSYSSDIITLFF